MAEEKGWNIEAFLGCSENLLGRNSASIKSLFGGFKAATDVAKSEAHERTVTRALFLYTVALKVFRDEGYNLCKASGARASWRYAHNHFSYPQRPTLLCSCNLV